MKRYRTATDPQQVTVRVRVVGHSPMVFPSEVEAVEWLCDSGFCYLRRDYLAESVLRDGEVEVWQRVPDGREVRLEALPPEPP